MTKRDAAQSRARLIMAASALFSASGYGEVNVRAIAQGAELNVALIHRYFGSKAGLFRAVVEHAFASSAWTPTRDDWEGLAAQVLAKRQHPPAIDLTRILVLSAGCEEIREDVTWALQHTESTLWPLWEDPRRARTRAGVVLGVLLGIDTSQNILHQRLWLGSSDAEKIALLAAILRAAA